MSGLLNDHAADGMPDQDRPFFADLLQEVPQRVRERGHADGRQRRRAAIPRHVPGDGVVSTAEVFQLATPAARRAAYAVQEHQRRRGGVAGGLVAEAAVAGFHGCRSGHTGPPDRSNLPMLTGRRRMKSDISYLKQVALAVRFRPGRRTLR
jgi:hypothetical protein